MAEPAGNFVVRYRGKAAFAVFIGLFASLPAYVLSNFSTLVVRDKTFWEWLAGNGWRPRYVLLAAVIWLAISGAVSLVLYWVLGKIARWVERRKPKRTDGPLPNQPVIHASFELTNIFQKHHQIEMDNPLPIILHNAGPATAFEVQLSDIDLGEDRVARFPMVPHVGSAPIEIMAEIEHRGRPLLGQHDLAGALTASIYAKQNNQPLPGPTISPYPLHITYRDSQEQFFESLCEIQVSSPPDYKNIKTVYVGVKPIARPQPQVREALPEPILPDKERLELHVELESKVLSGSTSHVVIFPEREGLLQRNIWAKLKVRFDNKSTADSLSNVSRNKSGL